MARPRTHAPASGAPPAHRRRIGALVLVTMRWGCDAAAAKYALRGFGPLTLLAVQLVIAAAVLWVILVVRCRRSGNYALAAPRGVYALLGVLEPGLAYGGLNYGLAWTSAVTGSLIGGLEGFCTFMLAALVLRRRVTSLGLLAAAVSGTGAVLVGLSGATLRTGLGDALVLGGCTAARPRGRPHADDRMAIHVRAGVRPSATGLAMGERRGSRAGERRLARVAGRGHRQSSGARAGLPAVERGRHPGAGDDLSDGAQPYPAFGVAFAILVLGEQLALPAVAGGAVIVAGIAAFDLVHPAGPDEEEAEPPGEGVRSPAGRAGA